MQFGSKRIGPSEPCFIVAEIGQNHQGDIYHALRLIGAAVKAGADAVKFCKRHIPSELTAEAAARPYAGPNSFGATYGEHRERLELSAEDYQHLQRRISYNRWPIELFATVCDLHSLGELEPLDLPGYKIASRDIDNEPLLRAVADTRRPVILSSGMADQAELEAAIGILPEAVVLRCTSRYPCPPEDVHLRSMTALNYVLDLNGMVGLSDHTPGIGVSVRAAAMGAVVIERHLTMSRAQPGTDHGSSLDPDEFAEMVALIRQGEAAMGSSAIVKPDVPRETEDKLRRSLVSRRIIPIGDIITAADVCLKSPGTGLRWCDRGAVVGQRAAVTIPADTTLRPAHIDAVEIIS